MHDELDASLTHIMLMSELASKKSDLAALPRIVQKARTVSSTLDQIVWTTNPRNDTLSQLVGYIAEFAREYLANTEIELHMELPQDVPTCEVSSEKRHHLLQVIKEAFNNVAKHSGARNVHLGISLRSDKLHIVIRDDGRGFDPSVLSPNSNGLLNMRHRIAEIAGTLTIESQPDHGTTVTLSVKI